MSRIYNRQNQYYPTAAEWAVIDIAQDSHPLGIMKATDILPHMVQMDFPLEEARRAISSLIEAQVLTRYGNLVENWCECVAT